MNRAQLEHLIRAAASVADDQEIIVVGSQAILGQFPDAAPALLASMEADVFPKNVPERADLIDGTLGEGSPFHETFGYYAQGVGPETAKLAEGWRDRLIPVRIDSSRAITGWCLETHDLVSSKCIAGREKDVRFLEEAVAQGLVDRDVLLERIDRTPVDLELRVAAAARVRAAFAR